MTRATVFILAGGSGTRLKPLSLTGKGKLPKQFLRLFREKTLLQEAITRIPPGNSLVIVPEAAYSDAAYKQASEIGIAADIFEEPFGCNTGPAVAAASARTALLEQDPSRIICFLPADHMMDAGVFQTLFNQAVQRAYESEKIITIGITPNRPETGYGYIRVDGSYNSSFQQVREYVEKPDKERAKKYLESGKYFWNAGIFFAKAHVFLDACRIHAPEIFQPIVNNISGLTFDIESAYRKIMNEHNTKSIDYALMEKIPQSIELLKAPESLHWNDLGTWESLSPYMEKDNDNNHWLGDAPPPDISQSKDVMVYNYTDLPVQISNLSKVVVVVTHNGILVRSNNS